MKSEDSGKPKDNVELLRSVLEEAYRTGNNQPLLDLMTEDVVWKVTIPEGTPLSGEYRGKQAVVGYFARLPEVAEFQQLRTPEYVGHGDQVISLGIEDYLVKKTGKTFRSEYASVTEFHEGRITKMVVIQDLCGIADAYRSN